MKGIILAGGLGTRLYPITTITTKSLLPIYNKPMIFYPLSMLMLAGIRDILIITTPQDSKTFESLLGNGDKYGITITYDIQPNPAGIAQAFIIAEDFIGKDDVCLILGDNIFYGKTLPSILKTSYNKVLNGNKSIIFASRVNNPERYGVIEFGEDDSLISIEEKPISPKSNHAVVGLYFYKNDVVAKAKIIMPSGRGELEITDINELYLNESRLDVQKLDSVFWLDTGTHDSLVEASNFIKTVENREGKRVSCLEEIAFKYNYIDRKKLKQIISNYNNDYGKYLEELLNE
tara:strand:+ start:2774 stop:3643 length:870 start_codon:yes stop_codon:yes gene_type:complete